jgi:hypothetical protein
MRLSFVRTRWVLLPPGWFEALADLGDGVKVGRRAQEQIPQVNRQKTPTSNDNVKQ